MKAQPSERLTPNQTAALLLRYGYLCPDDAERVQIASRIVSWNEPALRTAIAAFQHYFGEELDQRAMPILGRGVISDGVIGPVTEALLLQPRCGVADILGSVSGAQPAEANFPLPCRDDLRFAPLFDALAPLSAEQTDQALHGACKSWSEVLRLYLSIDRSLGKNAHIWATAGRLSGSTLAWSYLAQNSCAAHLEQRYNTSVNWDRQYLQAVSAHELGHALGLDHDQSPSALMYPYARQDVYLPQASDIAQAKRKGYFERTDEPPPPPPPPPTDIVVAGQITINGRPYRLVAATTGTPWFG